MNIHNEHHHTHHNGIVLQYISTQYRESEGAGCAADEQHACVIQAKRTCMMNGPAIDVRSIHYMNEPI